MTDTERISNRPSGRMNGGRALAEMLRLAGVGPMFGMGGFQLLPFYDALSQLGMRHFLINDERCGAFAAEAYARVTNRPGVCDGTLGPGATNLVTGLIEALNAGTPMIALAGDTNRAHSWKNMTQECRQTEILAPRGQGADPGRADEPGPRIAAPRLCSGDFRPAGPGVARRSRGCLPRRARLCRRGFRDRPDDLERAGPAHPARQGRHRPCHSADRARQAPADPGRRRHPSFGGIRGAPCLCRGAVDPGRPYDERQGRHRLHPCAVGRPIRSLLADRQRADRGLGLSSGRRLQARRDRDQALRATAREHPTHPSRHSRRGDRALRPGYGSLVGRRARRARGSCRSARR